MIDWLFGCRLAVSAVQAFESAPAAEPVRFEAAVDPSSAFGGASTFPDSFGQAAEFSSFDAAPVVDHRMAEHRAPSPQGYAAVSAFTSEPESIRFGGWRGGGNPHGGSPVRQHDSKWKEEHAALIAEKDASETVSAKELKAKGSKQLAVCCWLVLFVCLFCLFVCF